MKGGKAPRGYTIIEVMIVLAVSGVIFLIAINFINGKQEKASFTQGVNQMASQIQDIIEQVGDGKYSDIPLNCTFTGTNTVVSSGSKTQGTNPNCVFLGKIVHFLPDPNFNYDVLSLAGGRADPITDAPITTPDGAHPKAITDLTDNQATPQQLNIINVTVNNSATQSFAIGFIQGQGSTDIVGGTSLQDGPQAVSLYYMQGLDNAANHITPIDGSTNFVGRLKTASEADICLTDGTQYADILLGANSDQLNVNVKMDGKTEPASCL